MTKESRSLNIALFIIIIHKYITNFNQTSNHSSFLLIKVASDETQHQTKIKLLRTSSSVCLLINKSLTKNGDEKVRNLIKDLCKKTHL